jgi:hypothetical protein
MPGRHHSHRRDAILDAVPSDVRGTATEGSFIDPRTFGLVKAAYGVGETLELLSIGRTSLYAAVKRGELTPVKFGKKTLFCAADLATFLIRLKEAASKSEVAPFRRRSR